MDEPDIPTAPTDEDHPLLGPVDWELLTAEQADIEWAHLNRWVNWLRRTYGLPASVVPPLWHRHPELVEELSALRTHRIALFDPNGASVGPLRWHQDFALARARLRDWVAAAGTHLHHDRPTRQTPWPGEAPDLPVREVEIQDRREDFVAYVRADLARRRCIEAEIP